MIDTSDMLDETVDQGFSLLEQQSNHWKTSHWILIALFL